jgi:hypothetical protein
LDVWQIWNSQELLGCEKISNVLVRTEWETFRFIHGGENDIEGNEKFDDCFLRKAVDRAEVKGTG